MSPETAGRLLGVRTFTSDDQQWFASVSHDRNPLHSDPVAARRLLSGRQVVHGIHVLLSALDLVRPRSADAPFALHCEFSNPINVQDQVAFTAHEEPFRSTVAATVAGLACTHVVIETRPDAVPKGRLNGDRSTARALVVVDEPFDEPPAALLGRSFVLGEEGAEQLALRFPNAAAWLLPHRLAALGSLSRFVGMVCPGLHSIFSSVRFTLGEQRGSAGELTFLVRKYDDRFGLFVVAFDGCIQGELRAFRRPPPRLQPSMRDVAAQVAPREFGGTRSLVIGGSRGLGETVAKILAAGGGDVTISWAVGAEDAKRVAGEINAHAPGSCNVLKLDVSTDAFDRLGLDASSLDAVYFFATPRIFRKKEWVFDRQQFEELFSYYVERFYDLCMWLERERRGGKAMVYMPSSVFVAERPRGMTEYAMAKAAAEILAQDLNRSLNHVSIAWDRLPRLATDQTASVLNVGDDSTLAVLLPVVRRLRAEATSAEGLGDHSTS
jgi:acyl dehydratase